MGTFPEHYRSAVLRVRAALTRILLSVGADPTKPQQLARRFGLNKNLAWMVSKMINTPDVYSVAPHIPGAARIDSLLSAMKRVGAAAEGLEELRSAVAAFDLMVTQHAGDRATLELMISELSSENVKGEQLLQSRKQAFCGLSGILGAQMRLRLMCYVLAPSAADPDLVDLVEVSGLFDFRRLRTDARWLLFRRERWTDDAPELSGTRETPLRPGTQPDGGLPLLTEVCSSPIPRLDVIQEGLETQYELPPGPVGSTAALTLAYGVVARQVGPAYRDAHNRTCDLACSLSTPTETLLFDVLIHERFGWALHGEMGLYSRMDGEPVPQTLKRERNRLPFTENLEPLGRGVATLITPHLRDYTDLVRSILGRVRWNPEEFQALRFTLAYPPIPALAVYQVDLPERPA